MIACAGLITDFVITNNNVGTFNLNFKSSMEAKEISIRYDERIKMA